MNGEMRFKDLFDCIYFQGVRYERRVFPEEKYDDYLVDEIYPGTYMQIYIMKDIKGEMFTIEKRGKNE